ncbi:MAG: CaiB/BaiF CoA transferase family protein [Caulobacterales bacterium]
MSDKPYPLAGLKVLDFSRVLAGPFAGRLLSDLGADVVKIEPPDGDITRLWGRVAGGLAGYYFQQNAGKRNVSLDLRAPGARALVLELAAKADVVIENYRPDVMPRLGVGYQDLKAVNPRLVMLSISGFGQGGPESHRPAYAPIVHAEVGLHERAARRSGLPPRELPLSVADTNASLHGLVGLLSALLLRERTGLGQHIDIAMLDATVATDDQLQFDIENAQVGGPLPPNIWESGAGPILISGDFRYVWRLFTGTLGVPEVSTPDMDLPTKIAARRAAAEAFVASLKTWDEVERAMASINVAWGRVRPAASVREQPTLIHRRSFVDVDDRAGGVRPVAQSPYRWSNAVSGVRGPAPYRGEHNRQVLAEWLAKSDADVEALERAGVLTREPDALERQGATADRG